MVSGHWKGSWADAWGSQKEVLAKKVREAKAKRWEIHGLT